MPQTATSEVFRRDGLSFDMRPKDWLKTDPLLAAVRKFAADSSIELYLVGGYLRDRVRGRVNDDIDVLIRADVALAGPELATRLAGHFFLLDGERGVGRVVLRPEAPRTVDLTELKTSVEENLAERDFTVDAIALDFRDLSKERLESADLVQPAGGLADLDKAVIRMVTARALADDPLRLLRGVRLAAELECSIEPVTASAIRDQASLLASVSAERVGAEFLEILGLARSASALRDASDLGVLQVVLPELFELVGVTQGGHHHLDVFDHSILVVSELERIVANLSVFFPDSFEQVGRHLSERCGGHSRAVIMKAAALFHDLGKAKTRQVQDGKIRFFGHAQIGAEIAAEVLVRLRLGRTVTRTVTRIITEHLRPGFLGESGPSDRAVKKFLRDAGAEVVEVALVSLADWRGSRGPAAASDKSQSHLDLLRSIVEVAFVGPAPKHVPIVNGNDLIKEFGMATGPLIGRLLNAVEEAYFSGEITTREEALAFVRRQLDSEPPEDGSPA